MSKDRTRLSSLCSSKDKRYILQFMCIYINVRECIYVHIFFFFLQDGTPEEKRQLLLLMMTHAADLEVYIQIVEYIYICMYAYILVYICMYIYMNMYVNIYEC